MWNVFTLVAQENNPRHYIYMIQHVHFLIWYKSWNVNLRWYVQVFTSNPHLGVTFYLEVSKFNQAYVFFNMDSSKKKTDDLLQDSS